jgi:outer membrane lipoprotein-sorting protein
MKRIVFSLLLLATTFIAKAQTADEIIAKHLEAIGGADAWKKVNSIKMEGTMQVQGATVSMTQTVLHGKGNRQDISFGGMNGFMIIAPTSGWNFMPFNGQAAPEPMTAEDVAEGQADLDAQGNLVDYAAKGHTVEYLGKDDVEGTDCFKLKVNLKSGKPETLYLDAKSYLIIRSVSVQKANGQEVESTVNFSNYEKLPEGIMVPKSLGLPFGEMNITKITINGPVDESIFKN